MALRRLERCKTKWTPDAVVIAEANETQKRLHAPSTLASEEAKWKLTASSANNVAATRMQAAQRGRAARKEVDAKRAAASETGASELARSPPSMRPQVLDRATAYQPAARTAMPGAKNGGCNERPRTAHR